MTTTKTTTKKTATRKACSRCGKTKALDAFGAYKPSKDGRTAYCLDCGRAYAAERKLFVIHAAALGLSKDETIQLGRALQRGLTAPLAPAKPARKRAAIKKPARAKA